MEVLRVRKDDPSSSDVHVDSVSRIRLPKLRADKKDNSTPCPTCGK